MSEPSSIAVVGMACRLPGAASPAAFWQLLRDGRDAIAETAGDRWDAERLAEADTSLRGLRRGAFLDAGAEFDAAFFGISPREAAVMDPQQRLVLELTWEALEEAGIVPENLRGSRAGTFVGASSCDYGDLLRRHGAADLTRHAATGTSRAIIANRVSYVLGLRGPSLAVDTAQASALVAVHLACESLRRGESTLALAGGVNLNLGIESAVAASKLGALPPDGRCYAFDSLANGYVRGEGGGVVVLKRLDDALADGDHIHCVIRGTAVNHDGGGDALTAPDAEALEEVLRVAYAHADIDPADVQYIEAHGTGTPLGDRAEATALSAVLGARRLSANALLVGSATSNVGHLEGAAGIVGLIKTILCVKHREIPASLNFHEPTADIGQLGSHLGVQDARGAWPDPGRPLLAGVSSNGMGGTNCHVVLAEPPPAPLEPAPATGGPVAGVLAWVLSAKSQPALRDQARNLLEHIGARPDLDAADVAWSLATSRSRFACRAVVLGADREQLLEGLGSLADGVPSARAIEGVADDAAPGAVFMLPGFGAQWEQMARELLDGSPVFAQRMAECDEALSAFVPWSVREVIRGLDGAPDLANVDVGAPALFAVNVSLAALWRACGVHPTAVVGHSHGEIAAAHVAGGLSLHDAARLVALRGKALTRIAGRGAMASVALTPDDLAERLAAWGADDVVLAAVNGPSSTVVAGAVEAVDALLSRCEAEGVRSRKVAIAYASHSPQIEAVHDELLAAAGGVTLRAGDVPFYSTVTGQQLDLGTVDAEHWYRGERQPVRFEGAVRTLIGEGHRTFVEVSPHPVLTAGAQETVEAVLGSADGVAVASTLRRGHGGAERFMASLAGLYVRGRTVDWAALVAGARRVELPTYAFQRERHWLQSPANGDHDTQDALAPASNGADTADAHPRNGAASNGAATDGPGASILARRLGGMSGPERERTVRELVLTQVALVLGHASAADVDAGSAFKDLGFDSAAAVELRDALTRVTGLRLAASLLYDHPTPAAVAGLMLAEATGVRRAGAMSAAALGTDEPIAIVGMSCRYPGAVTSPGALWELVMAEQDAIGDFPADRGWALDELYHPDPDHPGTSYTRHGGFIDGAGEFDADFFAISPREALAMDPQQRLLMQGAWEALEDAGIEPLSLAGSLTGVFVGLTAADYGPRLHEAAGGSEGYALTGLTPSVASGRIAYALGLQGPAMSIDTACSASLVALHLACQALRRGECELALAGGASVMANPGMFVEFSRQRGLSTDGRCKAFGAGADGTGWSEGVGLVVVEPLSRARALGHEVLAIVPGSAVNQDGASNGLTAPNGPSQERVIRQALASAGLTAADVDAVEAHGTGTRLGDPIEAQALLATYGRERAGGPLRLGSIKSNIGHTQAAAGIAGVIKMVQALRHERLPRSLHCEEPSPHVDWSDGDVRLLSRAEPWARGERVRRAGVSSFGVSGTNAHLIVEEAPLVSAPVGGADPSGGGEPGEVLPYVVSAASPDALGVVAERVAAFAGARPELAAGEFAGALALRRAGLTHRGVVLASSRDELVAGLGALAQREPAGGVLSGVASAAGQVAFVFSGQGSQWPGMGSALYARFGVFRTTFDEVCGELDGLVGCSVREIAFAGEGSEQALALGQTRLTQVALFALEVALARLVESFGVRPDVVIGHSVGEFAAAHLAGVFSLADGCGLIAERARLMGSVNADGAMLAVQAGEAEARDSLTGYEDRVAIAAVNGPRSVVLSGERDAVEELEAVWRGRGRKTTRLRVSHAFHSPQMDSILEDLTAAAGQITCNAPQIPVISNLTGRPLTAEQATSPDYWAQHVRQAVRFADGIRWMRDNGVTRLLELGPDGTLSTLAAHTLDGDDDVLIASSLRGHKHPQPGALLSMLGAAWCHGVAVDWRGLFDDRAIPRVELPTYPFQRERYWLTSPRGAGDLGAAGLAAMEHPLLGAVVDVAGEGSTERVFTGRLSLATDAWLADHVVGGAVLLAGAAFVELGVAVGRHVGASVLEELTLVAPLVFDGDRAVQLQVVVAGDGNARGLQIYARPMPAGGDDAADWVLHASGLLGAGDPDAGACEAFGRESWPPAGARPLEVEGVYDRLADAGYAYGPVFQGLRAAWAEGDVLYGEIALDDGERARAEGCCVHPALLDGILHVLLAGALEQGPLDAPLVPFAFSGIRVHGDGASRLRVSLTPLGGGRTQLLAVDESGVPVLSVDGLEMRAIDRRALRTRVAADGSLHRVDWTPVAAGSGEHDAPPPRVALLGDSAIDAAGLEISLHPDLAALEAHVERTGSAPAVVLVRAPHGGEDLASAVLQVTREMLAVLQAWLASAGLADSRLVVLTDRAAAVAEGESPNLAQAALAGLLRSAHSEHPGRVGVIDLDGGEPSLGALARVLAGEPELAIRAGVVLAPRLAAATPGGAVFSEREGTVLITGATGGLGPLVARHLAVAHGQRHLLLVSRRGPDADGAGELVASLEELGCDVRLAACDVADPGAVRELVAAIGDEYPVTAVVHAAGVLDDALAETLDDARLERVMAPKVAGAINLHEATKDVDLEQFVVFSSIACTLGNAGQGNYAAANAFLEALAGHRRAAGLPATALAWGPWAHAAGMMGGLKELERARWTQAGIGELSDEQGLALLDAALGADRAVLAPVRLNRDVLRGRAAAGQLPAIFGGLVRVPARRGAAGSGSLARRLAAAPASEAREIVLGLVQAQVAGVLGHASSEAVDPQRAFTELGFDSLSAVDLRNRLNQATGLKLPATLIFDHPTPAAVAELLRSRVDGAERVARAARPVATRTDEPIAIVGMSARYPGGVRSPEDLWRLVEEGRDAIGEFPVDRGWDLDRLFDSDPDHPHTSYAREAGFLYDAGEFDPEFFSISPREALAMDPQQRLLLEGAWEALEDARIDPSGLRGSDTGVFAGVMYGDYGIGAGMPADLEGFFGTSGSLLSGRLSYAFGLEGPAVSVDTACSSSLVALHLACQSLRQGECRLALAGGVTVLSKPTVFVQFSRQRALSPDGRCRSFGAGANGVAWSEGAGLLVLERLSDARRAGHRVLALLRGSAVNQDGASNGLTAPNGPSQERVIRQALANAGLAAADVDAVEAHGTGTTLGDPIEAQALLATYGSERAGRPLRLGSLKSNIGHTQAAAGVGGVIKMVQALRHEVLPRSLYCEEPSPHVDWSAGEVRLLAEAEPWEHGSRPRRAGVSSFGISGTNAHVIVEEAPRAEPALPAGRAPRAGAAPAPDLVSPAEVVSPVEAASPSESVTPAEVVSLVEAAQDGDVPVAVAVSGRGEAAVRAQAERLRAWLGEHEDVPVVDVGWSSLTTRAQLERRAVVVASDRAGVLAGLGALARGQDAEGVVAGRVRPGKTAFLLTGQGAQWAGMGRELAEHFSVFSDALDEVCGELDEHVGRSVRALMFAAPASPEEAMLGLTQFTQPALFALEVALYRLVTSWGVRADVLVGHSIGELVAAHVAGVLSLHDACVLVAARARLMGALAPGGAMLAVEATEDEVAESLEGVGEGVSVAAVNGPRAVVLSGEVAAIEACAAVWAQRDRRTSRLRVSHAFHSVLMEPMLDEFRAVAEGLTYGPAHIAVVSNVTGQVVDDELRDPGYWVRHVRHAVRFCDGVRELERLGVTRFVELGPDAVLATMARECVSEQLERQALFAGAMRRRRDQARSVAECLAALHASGADVNWQAWYATRRPRVVDLPTYAFQRERFWLAGGGVGDVSGAGLGVVEHPLLSAVLVSPSDGGGGVVTGRVSLGGQSWLADHAVFDRVLLPGMAFVELVLAAGGEFGCGVVEELTFEAPLVLGVGDAVAVQVVVGEGDGGRRGVEVFSCAGEGVAWVRHARGVLGDGVGVPGAGVVALGVGVWPPVGSERVDVSGLYDRLAVAGFGYGPVFQGVVGAWRRGDEVFCEVALGDGQDGAGFGVHPALLDAAFHGVLEQLCAGVGAGSVPLPFAVGGVRVHRRGVGVLRACLTVDGSSVALAAVDEAGRAVLEVQSLAVRSVDAARLGAAGDGPGDALFVHEWAEVSLPDNGASARCVVLGGGLAVGGAPRYGDLDGLLAAIDAGDLVAEVLLVDADALMGTAVDVAGAAHAGVVAVLELLQTWLASEACADTRLVFVTRGAMSVTRGEAPELAGAAAWGMLRSAQSEHPGRILLVDIDPAQDPGAIDWAALLDGDEPQLAIRDTTTYAPRLARGGGEPDADLAPWSPDGTVLITGGTSGLGALVARHLVSRHGVRGLLLVSRSGPEAHGACELERELAAAGAIVRVAACDVADRAQLARLLDSISPERPLTSVVHAAGLIDDAVVEKMTAEQVDRVMRPKVDGAWHLHELTADLDLDRFVLFSSAVATLGAPGQANYAAANAFCDALAALRRSDGLAGISLAWGLWEQATGMASELDGASIARWKRLGIDTLSVDTGLELFDLAAGSRDAFAMPARLELAALRVRAREGLLPSVLRSIVRIAARRRTDASGSLASRLAGMPEADRDAALVEVVRTEAAAVLGYGSGSAIEPDRSFRELGVDSLGGVELRNRIGAVTGLRLPATLVFDHPTCLAVARYLREQVGDAAPSVAVVRRSPSLTDEPIAIVGMSCRYPGAIQSTDDLWRLVSAGTDAIGGFPTDRGWDVERLYDPDPAHPGTTYAREGGFLYDAGDFDAEFFGIGPREALTMDPQQRLLLETAWEALEDSGIDPESLRGSDTGVFAGVMYGDYWQAGAGSEHSEGYLMIGSAGSVASGRVAYTLGLEGPAVTIDTACSSSLVALHLACQSLRQGECRMALAGGVTVLADPTLFVEFSRQRGLAPDGRCKSFGASANGVGWAEGAGLVVLERLSDASRLGHRVLAVVRGSAVNQDGASNGLTAPNGPSQERVIRQALANSGLSAADVDAVEAHGTGTSLGDPIEAQALLATYGRERADGPLRLGSIKSNIGHSQAAAGVAGVIKMVQALRHEVLPRSLHCDEPSPHVDWSAGEVRLLAEAEPWEHGARTRRAGVSSFGISGTNAHVILEEAPQVEPVPAVGAPPRRRDLALAGTPEVPVAVTVSARGEAALRAQAQRLAAWLGAREDLPVADVGWSSVVSRAQLERRAVVVGSDRDEVLAGLNAVARGEPRAGVAAGQVRPGKTVFVFPGQGSQWAGMAVELLATSTVFAESIAACDEALSRYVEWSLQDVLRGVEGAPGFERVDVVQPALFAVMVSLAAMWQSFGVVPAAVVGHSQGEIAAAYVAGALSLDDAARVVALRSRAVLDVLAGRGGMASVALAVDAAEELLERWSGRLSVAAVNGPASVVISGEVAALEELLAACEGDGVWVRRIPVDYPSHSAVVNEIADRLATDLAGISPRSGSVPFVSTVTAQPLDTAGLDAGYWYRNLRERVRFSEVVLALIEDGASAFVEMSPHPGLAVAITAAADSAGASDRVAAVGSLRRGEGGMRRFVGSLAEAHVNGVPVDWNALYAGNGVRRVDLPTYAFQRERFWLAGGGVGDVSGAGLGVVEHPLLSAVLVSPSDGGGGVVTGRVSLGGQSWLADHAVFDRVLLPGMAFVELVLAAGGEFGCGVVEELTFEAPLVLGVGDAVAVQVVVGEGDGGRRGVEVFSCAGEGVAWVRHARGVLGDGVGVPGAGVVALGVGVWPPVGSERVDVSGLYDRLAVAGFGYGPVFQGVVGAWRRGDEVFCEVALGDGQDGAGFGVHPALLDAAFHGVLEQLCAGVGAGSVPLPFAVGGVRVHRRGVGVLRACLTVDGSSVALAAVDEAGRAVLEVQSLAVRSVDAARLGAAGDGPGDALFVHEWAEVSLPDNGASARCVVLGGGLAVGGAPRYGDLDGLLAAIDAGDLVAEVLLVDADALMGTAVDVAGAAHAGVVAVLELLQTWLASEACADTRLVFVTRGAMSVTRGEAPELAGAAAWGMLRSAQSEHPGRILLVDIDPAQDPGAIDWAALLDGDEPQLAIRDTTTYAMRLARLDASDALTAPDGAWHLDAPSRGTLENLALVPGDRGEQPLKPDQVRIAVRAGGLNFRDVLIALGQYPDDDPIGSEGAGVVLEVGEAVTGLAAGDRVMGLIPESMGPVAVTDRRLVARMPHDWSFAEGASVPIVYMTAYYGLIDLAHLGKGETVLVHAGAGGVGMAAIQIAKHLGAEVYATASPGKWDVLRGFGLDDDHIASSRDLDFRDRFLAATQGNGVDVVLNALAREYVDASLELLPRGGRFVEMGKTDRRDPAVIAHAHPGVEYRAYDLMRDAGPDRVAGMLAEILALFEASALRHAPVRAWDVRDAATAFRFLGDGRNVGKVVLTIPRPLDPAGTVLITGGTGDLGARVARHLAGEHGVRELLLVGRRGPQSPGAAELGDELRALGAKPRIASCDVTDRDDLSRLLAGIDPEHPLTAVIHTAGVLDDGVIESLTPAQVDRVLRPKVDAAVLLHELTLGTDLAEFILFSSDSGTVGVPGQASYAAANVFLDALAERRRAAGLPAKSLAWGLWSNATGMAGNLDEVDIARLTRLGVAAMSDELVLFDIARAAAESLVVPTRLDMPALRAAAQAGTLAPLMRGIVSGRPRRTRGTGRSLEEQLAGVPEDDREGAVLDVVRAQIAVVLGHSSPEAIDPARKFKELGFDSLSAVELRNRLAQISGMRLPSTLIFDHPSPAAVAVALLEQLAPQPAAQADAAEAEIRHVLASISLEQLRGAGLLDRLLRLADTNGDEPPPGDGPASIEDLDLDELVRMAGP